MPRRPGSPGAKTWLGHGVEEDIASRAEVRRGEDEGHRARGRLPAASEALSEMGNTWSPSSKDLTMQITRGGGPLFILRDGSIRLHAPSNGGRIVFSFSPLSLAKINDNSSLAGSSANQSMIKGADFVCVAVSECVSAAKKNCALA